MGTLVDNKQNESVWIVVSKWILFTLAVAIIPIFLRWLVLALFNQSNNYSLLFREGQWFLIAVAISAEAIGDTLVLTRDNSQQQSSLFSIYLGGCSMLVILVASCLYAASAMAAPICPCPNEKISLPSINISYILTSSIILFVIAFVAGLWAKILSANSSALVSTNP